MPRRTATDVAISIPIQSNVRYANELLDLLVDVGPLTRADIQRILGWSEGRFTSALRAARDVVCPELGIAVPQVTPPDWRYEATIEWAPVEAGSSYALGHAETRLRSIRRDVRIVLPHLPKGTVEWRRANFLSKHLDHLLGGLSEIHGTGELDD
jgi:hypothetical protein